MCEDEQKEEHRDGEKVEVKERGERAGEVDTRGRRKIKIARKVN